MVRCQNPPFKYVKSKDASICMNGFHFKGYQILKILIFLIFRNKASHANFHKQQMPASLHSILTRVRFQNPPFKYVKNTDASICMNGYLIKGYQKLKIFIFSYSEIKHLELSAQVLIISTQKKQGSLMTSPVSVRVNIYLYWYK